MYYGRVPSRQHYIFGAAWVLLGLAVGLHFPDIDNRLQWLIPSWVLLHRSILTHGWVVPLLLFWLVRGDKAPSLRLFAIGFSLAFAVHFCFDFFPRRWAGFALIHVPVYGRTTSLFSQSWLILSIVMCLYVTFRVVRNVIEYALGIASLIISFIISAAENRHAVLLALMLLVFATAVTAAISRLHQKHALPHLPR